MNLSLRDCFPLPQRLTLYVFFKRFLRSFSTRIISECKIFTSSRKHSTARMQLNWTKISRFSRHNTPRGSFIARTLDSSTFVTVCHYQSTFLFIKFWRQPRTVNSVLRKFRHTYRTRAEIISYVSALPTDYTR